MLLGVLIFSSSCSESILGSRLAVAEQPGYFSETLTPLERKAN